MNLAFGRAVSGADMTVWAAVVALVAAFALATPAHANVDVRVESRPVSGPVQVYVKVTDSSGPVSGLTSADFGIFEDNVQIPLQPTDLTLPPSQGGAQHVSVIFVMDYSGTVQSTALDALEQAVKDFVNLEMQPGDEAAIIKFNNSRGVSLVQDFVPIDGQGQPNNLALEAAVDHPYSGTGTPLLDALLLAVNEFASPPHVLPPGPKAILLVSDGGENQSSATLDDVIALANENSLPIFTIGVGDVTQPGRTELMQGLGDETGGLYFPPAQSDEDVGLAYAAIAELLSNEYLITYSSGITDCAAHALRVEVTGRQPVTTHFARRTCDTEPDPFSFATQTGVEPNATVTSNTETITGIEVDAHISVIQGSYSIGCNGTFTTNPGEISNGDTVCVQQQASPNFSTSRTTTLTIGGVAKTFKTTTRSQSGGGGGGGGGGGALGLLEFLLLGGLGALQRRKPRVP
jgi:VWFA-related protein